MSTEMQSTRTLEVVAAEIRTFTASMLNNIIEIGRRMVEAKALLPHGEFLPWLKEQTGYSSSTANNFMRLYEAYGSQQGSLFGAELNCQTFGNLTYSKALALLSVPESEREAFVEEQDVENLSTRELKELIAERNALLRRAENAEDALREEKETSDALLDEADQLREKLSEMEKRPVDVAVQEADPAEIEKAVAAALEESAKTYEVELEKLQKKLDSGKAERDKLKAAAEAAEKKAAEAEKSASAMADDAKRAASAEADKYRMEAERLKKELAMADPATAEFKGAFEAAAQIVAKLVALAAQIPEERAENVKKAMAALAKQLEGV